MATVGSTTPADISHKPKSATLQHVESPLKNMRAEFSSGLEFLTRAIFNSTTPFMNSKKLVDIAYLHLGLNPDEHMSVPEANARLANLVREVSQTHGWIMGWACLAQVAPDCGLNEQFMADATTCAEIYSRIQVSPNRSSPIDVAITVSSSPNVDSLTEIGPKGLGGKAWKMDSEYHSLSHRWTARGYAPMGPAIAFGWSGVIKKSVQPQDDDSCRAMQMLGLMDYDLDLDVANNPGFANSLQEASKNATKSGDIQGAAVAALLNNDMQTYVRSIQMSWVKAGRGSFVIGPDDVSVDDWVKANAIDCAAILGFGYQDPSRHVLSIKGVFIGNLLANMHDSLYDMGCSSRMSNVLYALGAGVARQDVHRATGAVALACMDNIARRNRDISNTDIPLYGDCMGTMAFSWSAFNGRYRTWERFVKYSRQLGQSKSTEAKAILKAANKQLVFIEKSADADIATTWKEALSQEGVNKLTERTTYVYIPPSGDGILSTPGVTLPDLCKSCEIQFLAAVHAHTDDEIHAIPGLPDSVTSCKSLGLAAAIRRSAIFAASNTCCDVCACRIGNWGDNVAYRVMVTLMKSEEETSPREWVLQHYIVACVDFWPVSVPSILAGFDMAGDLKYDDGAMGIRDVVDC